MPGASVWPAAWPPSTEFSPAGWCRSCTAARRAGRTRPARRKLGGGDIKLTGLAGLVLGWLGWPTLLAGALAGFALAALVSLGLLAARRVSLHNAISFGPFLLGGALLAIVATGGGPA